MSSKFNSFLYDDDNSDRKSLAELEKRIKSLEKSKHSKMPSPSRPKCKQSSMLSYCIKSEREQVPSSSKTHSNHQHNSLKKSPVKTRSRNSRKKSISPKKVTNGKITKQTKKGESSNKLPSISRWIKKDRILENCIEVKGESSNKSPSISGWIKKDRVLENCAEVKKEKGNKNKKPNSKPLKEKNKKTFKRSSSGSFDKYGVRTPSFQEIVEYRKKLEDQKRCMEVFEGLEKSQDSINFNLMEPKTSVAILDCKHLTEDQISEAFNSNYQYICDVYHGTTYSKRHELFEKGNCKDHSSLSYNNSMITFTIEQKHLLLSHLDKTFNEKLCSNTTRYFFKVLLPELCTKIFMDVHSMTYDEANKYLESRPTQHKDS